MNVVIFFQRLRKRHRLGGRRKAAGKGEGKGEGEGEGEGEGRIKDRHTKVIADRREALELAAPFWLNQNMNKDESKRRKNGLERPWEPLQIVTWALFPLILTYFYAFLVPLIRQIAYLVIVAIVFGIASCVAAAAAYLTCAIDPVDESILQNNGQQRERVYCYLCTSNIKKQSRHCITCKKCVDVFDHHCKWLNTCVGVKNYRYFLMVVFSVTTQTSLLLAVACQQLVQYFLHHSSTVRKVHNSVADPLGSIGTLCLLIIGIGVMLPLVALVWQLLCFHVMLVYKGLTTYDFIIQQQKLQQERQQQRRIASDASRRRNSRSFAPSPATIASKPQTSARPPQPDDYKPSLTVEQVENADATHVSPTPPSQTIEAVTEQGDRVNDSEL